MNGYRNIYINGYVQVTSAANGSAPLDAPLDITDPLLAQNAAVNTPNGNAYGVPWIVGAKKGFPTFNKFSMETVISVIRKLEILKSAPNSTTFIQTNVMWIFGISNSIGSDCWNSYVPAYPNQVQVVMTNLLAMSLVYSNDNSSPTPFPLYSSYPGSFLFSLNSTYGLLAQTQPLAPWPGCVWNTANARLIDSNLFNAFRDSIDQYHRIPPELY